jgi:hypothetical protein
LRRWSKEKRCAPAKYWTIQIDIEADQESAHAAFDRLCDRMDELSADSVMGGCCRPIDNSNVEELGA